MNTKIREIALKCGMEDYPTYGVNALYGERDIEKFAKDIVQTVLDSIEDHKLKMLRDGERVVYGCQFNDTIDGVLDMLKDEWMDEDDRRRNRTST